MKQVKDIIKEYSTILILEPYKENNIRVKLHKKVMDSVPSKRIRNIVYAYTSHDVIIVLNILRSILWSR